MDAGGASLSPVRRTIDIQTDYPQANKHIQTIKMDTYTWYSEEWDAEINFQDVLDDLINAPENHFEEDSALYKYIVKNWKGYQGE